MNKMSYKTRTNNPSAGFKVIIIFALSGLCVVFFIRDGIKADWNRDYASSLVKRKTVVEYAADSAGSRENSVSAAESRLERMAMYKERYNYQLPEPYEEHASRDELCGTGPDYEQFFRMKNDARSANNEDRTIYERFFKKGLNKTTVKGNIVEMGAFNGVRESNSRLFETCLGWNTLLVEGNPRMFESLVPNRPHAHRFNFAPSCSEEDERNNKTVPFDYVVFTNGGLHDGSVKTAYLESNETKVVDVPCGSLTKVLLDVFPGGHVSFFSLDVEGAEPYVLENIDLNRVFVEMFIVENRNVFCGKECESRDKFRKILTDHGYILFDKMVIKSDLFIHPLSEHLEKL
mmetsp:Transcript_23542/g.55415  ORF Transcript_23542/g.55415 Transcript_23542/m.55415 type:complete len:346 (-) Transcript_23542:147-1184(-)